MQSPQTITLPIIDYERCISETSNALTEASFRLSMMESLGYVKFPDIHYWIEYVNLLEKELITLMKLKENNLF